MKNIKYTTKEWFRVIVILALKIVLHIFWFVPIKRKLIIFNSYQGSQYSCSPKYLYKYFKDHFGDEFTYIWILNSVNTHKDLENIKTIKFLSLKYFYYVCICNVYITNVFVEPFIPKRNKQIFINTWHGGGAYKGNSDVFMNNKAYIFKNKMRNKITNYYLASCQAIIEAWVKDFNFEKYKFLPTGLPRNDIFFNCTDNIKDNVKTAIGLERNKKVLLYCPTWRYLGRNQSENIDINFNIREILMVAKERFGNDFIFLFRGHHCMKDMVIDDCNIIDVSNYSDMQEILLITDFMINDYSSSQWDYALSNKPGLLYVPDLEEYEKFQHFFTPIKDWPYDLAFTPKELIEKIKNYNEKKSKLKIEAHLSKLGNFDKGMACKLVADMILKEITDDNN